MKNNNGVRRHLYRAPGYVPNGPWTIGVQRRQSEFPDMHIWVEDEDGTPYDNIGCLAPHTLDNVKYVRKRWQTYDAEYDKFMRGIREQVGKVARDMKRDGENFEDVLEMAQAELEQQPLTSFRVAALQLRKMGGAGRLRIGSFGIRFGEGNRQVMWLHGNGATQSAQFKPGTAAEHLKSGGGLMGTNGKFYAYCA